MNSHFRKEHLLKRSSSHDQDGPFKNLRNQKAYDLGIHVAMGMCALPSFKGLVFTWVALAKAGLVSDFFTNLFL